MAKKIFGLQYLKFGPIANDGGMGTKLVTIGETVTGSANMTQEDNTNTDITIEESDSPIETIVSTVGKILFNFSTYNVSYRVLQKLFGGTGNLPLPLGAVATLGTLTGGSSYVDGFYENVALTGGTGSGARADITVASGSVSALEIVAPGEGYTADDELTTANTNLGGAGSGFKVIAATVASSATPEKWEAPDAFPDVEMSWELKDKKGNIVRIPRGKASPKIALTFTKEGVGQLDVEVSVLQPTKSGEKRLTIQFA